MDSYNIQPLGTDCSLSIIPWKIIQAVPGINSSFLVIAEYYPTVWICHGLLALRLLKDNQVIFSLVLLRNKLL